MKYVMSAIIASTLCTGAIAGEKESTSFGLGMGVPYGILGLNVSHAISEELDLTAGYGIGWDVGVRYRPVTDQPNFRITTLYGTNYALQKDSSSDMEFFQGFNLGVGYGPMSDGWDVDLIYVIIPQAAKDRADQLRAQGYNFSGDTGNTIKLSFGYHW